jgi:phospholipid/cholesterol/gamma-HCH transport system substrate-binding protein
MNKDRNALKAGTFIVVAMILTVSVVVAIKDFGHFAEPTAIRSAKFKLTDDIGGLRVGDEVRVGGFKVGSVRTIEPVGVDGGGEAALVITFTIPKKYVLRDGAKVGVQSMLTGASILNITDMGSGPAVADGVSVAGTPDPKSILFAQLGDAKIADTVAAFKKTADEATGTISQVRGKVDPLYGKVATVADRAGETMTHARDILGQGKGDLTGTFANLKSASGTVKEKLPVTMDNANALLTKIQSSVDKVQTTLDDVKATVANTKDVSATARSIVSGNRSKLDAMVTGLKTTSDNLKAASSEIRRSPWRLLYKPAKGEMANLNLYDSARQFAEGANDLNDAAAALRDALASKEVDAKVLQSLVNKLDETFTGFQKVETQLWERVNVRE